MNDYSITEYGRLFLLDRKRNKNNPFISKKNRHFLKFDGINIIDSRICLMWKNKITCDMKINSSPGVILNRDIIIEYIEGTVEIFLV